MLNEIKQDAQTRMAKSIDALKHTLTSIRTGRASPALLDRITVKAYGTDTPLNQVASISVSEGHSLVITLFDKGMIKDVEKAIYASDLGLTPNVAGTVIRLNLPPPTEERRKELGKQVQKEGEGAKIATATCTCAWTAIGTPHRSIAAACPVCNAANCWTRATSANAC
jgi:ribosome recycling factor